MQHRGEVKQPHVRMFFFLPCTMYWSVLKGDVSNVNPVWVFSVWWTPVGLWTPECSCSTQHLEQQHCCTLGAHSDYLHTATVCYLFSCLFPFAIDDVVSVPVGFQCLCVCDLGTLVVESREKTKPIWPCWFGLMSARIQMLLPGQRGRQSGTSGVFWSLGLIESPLQNKTHNLIWFIRILPYHFQY